METEEIQIEWLKITETRPTPHSAIVYMIKDEAGNLGMGNRYCEDSFHIVPSYGMEKPTQYARIPKALFS